MKEYAGHRKYDSLLVRLLHQIASYKLREELVEYFCDELFEISSCDMIIVLESYENEIKSIDDIEIFKLLDKNPRRDILATIRNGHLRQKVNKDKHFKAIKNKFKVLNDSVLDKDVSTYHSSYNMIDFCKYFIPLSSFKQGGWLTFVFLPRPTPKHVERFMLLWYGGDNIQQTPDTLTQDERVLYLFSNYYELASFNIKSKAKIIYEQRMELLKALVPSMISHEIYQKTRNIAHANSLIIEDNKKILEAKTLEEAQKYSKEIDETMQMAMLPSIHSLGDITSSISKLTKQIPSEIINIKQMLEESILIMNTTASRLGIHIRLFSPDIEIETDRALAMHLIMNLIANSVDAYDGIEMEDELIDIKVDNSSEESVNIYVSDYAKGIDKAIADRLFDEGFSTKKEGNGLGLSICSYIVGFLGGSISLVKYKKYKTTFKISLPRDSFKSTTLKEEI